MRGAKYDPLEVGGAVGGHIHHHDLYQPELMEASVQQHLEGSILRIPYLRLTRLSKVSKILKGDMPAKSSS